jgi:nicotinamidase/pyrazinamidase
MGVDILYWPVDIQRDFIDEDGKLTVKAREIRENIAALTRRAGTIMGLTHKAHDYRVMGSVDAHTADDPEFKTYPEHCVRGTPGQLLIPEAELPKTLYVRNEAYAPKLLDEMAGYREGPVMLEKQHPDVFTNPNTDALLSRLNPKVVALYGVCTDICVNAAAEGFLKRGYTVAVITDAIKEYSADAARACKASWAGKGARFMTTDEVLEGGLEKLLAA